MGLVAVISFSAAKEAKAATPPGAGGWTAFAEQRTGECVGPTGALDQAMEIEIAGHRYRLEGHRLVQLDHDRDDRLRIGVISAIKDDRKPTERAVRDLLRRLKKKGVDLIVANGDLAENEFQMRKVFGWLAESGLPVLAIAGNTESCGSFNRVATEVFVEHPGFWNGNWIRQLELDDGTLMTLPGYFDRRFAHKNSAALYKQEDVLALRSMIDEAPGPIILVSHGPPKMKKKGGLDIATGAGHVGDPMITELLDRRKIRFGLFGHILEAGGRGADLVGRKKKAKRWHSTLYVNAGTANPDPWAMLSGRTKYGMGLWYELRKKKARFETLWNAKPRRSDDD